MEREKKKSQQNEKEKAKKNLSIYIYITDASEMNRSTISRFHARTNKSAAQRRLHFTNSMSPVSIDAITMVYAWVPRFFSFLFYRVSTVRYPGGAWISFNPGQIYGLPLGFYRVFLLLLLLLLLLLRIAIG